MIQGDLMRSFFFLAMMAFVLTGCPKSYPPPDNPIKKPEVLRAAIDARVEGFETVRFKEVVLDYFGDGERVKVRQLLLVKQPEYLRIQTRMPGSDELLNVLVSDGETFAMHKRDTHEYYTGPATKENVARLLPVDLSAADVSRVMLAGAPWDRFGEGSEPTLEWDSRKGTYRYRAEVDGGELSMWVRHTDYAVVEVLETGPDDDEVYRYTTDDWERYQPGALPDYRRFVWPERDLDFSMDVGETQVDIELPNILFELAPPPGSKILRLDG